mgnify:CR=1 FL=1
MTELEMIVEGFGEMILEWEDGTMETRPFENKVVDKGRTAVSKSLTNQFSGIYAEGMTAMDFGSGGKCGDAGVNGQPSRPGCAGACGWRGRRDGASDPERGE